MSSAIWGHYFPPNASHAELLAFLAEAYHDADPDLGSEEPSEREQRLAETAGSIDSAWDYAEGFLAPQELYALVQVFGDDDCKTVAVVLYADPYVIDDTLASALAEAICTRRYPDATVRWHETRGRVADKIIRPGIGDVLSACADLSKKGTWY